MAQRCPLNFCSVCPFAISSTSHLIPGKVSVELCSGAQMKPRRQSSESFLVCLMVRPPTSSQLSRLCQLNPPASQGSRVLSLTASPRG